MYGVIFDVVILSPNWGRGSNGWLLLPGAVDHGIGHGSRPVKTFSHAETAPVSCGASGQSGDFCRAFCPPRATRVECRGCC